MNDNYIHDYCISAGASCQFARDVSMLSMAENCARIDALQ